MLVTLITSPVAATETYLVTDQWIKVQVSGCLLLLYILQNTERTDLELNLQNWDITDYILNTIYVKSASFLF